MAAEREKVALDACNRENIAGRLHLRNCKSLAAPVPGATGSDVTAGIFPLYSLSFLLSGFSLRSELPARP
jgi:hypothetical protein